MNVCIGIPSASLRVFTVPVLAVATERRPVTLPVITRREQWIPSLIQSVYVFTGRMKDGIGASVSQGLRPLFVCVS